MNPVLLASLLEKALVYGPTALSVVSKLMADIQAGKTQTTVAPEDVAELARLSALNAAEIFRRMGVEPPPKA